MNDLNDLSGLDTGSSETIKFVSPKQAARMLAVSESSMKRWCDKGLLEIHRTAGGHRRIPVPSLLDFVRTGGHQLLFAEEIGLPANVGSPAAKTEADALEVLCKALTDGNEANARRLILSSWLSGTPLHQVLDEYIAPVFLKIGDQWEHREVEIYQERRAVLMAERVLMELRNLQTGPRDDAPVALGATLENDPYSLPTSMCELTLRSCGWAAQNLGAWQPAETLVSAIETHRPRIFWLSVSSTPDKELFRSSLMKIHETTERFGTALIVGGRSLRDEEARQGLNFTAFCESMTRLHGLANQLIAPNQLPS